jgi:mono/diheme cytochrome c family protein
MLGARLSSGALGAVFFMLGAGAQAAELPPGPNRELVARECQACHNLDAVVASNETRETWNTLLDSMTSYGLRVSPEDRAKILDYLATALGPKPGTAR